MVGLVDTHDNLESGLIATAHPVGLFAKRFIDVALAVAGIALFAPLFILCALGIFFTSPGPVLYRHARIGFNGKSFNCLKFRTMVPNAHVRLQEVLAADPVLAAEWSETQKLHDDPRITAIGEMLRKSSLDELPQLFNVLRGDMSIVGPRPVTREELARYSTSVSSYLACRPGITGLWQVSGRSTTTYSKRVACDAFYASNWSMALDAKIIIVTLPTLLSEGAC
jgi:exopolysaccharide production protein ExoY